MLQNQMYFAKNGDTLQSIAKQFHISSWQMLYYANSNTSLRVKRPKPDQIKQGDLIIIPPDPIKAAQAKIDKLKQIQISIVELNRQLMDDWVKTYTRLVYKIAIIDLIPLFINFARDIVKPAFSLLAKSGDELAVANGALMKSSLKFIKDEVGEKSEEFLIDFTGVLDVKPNDGRVLAIGKEATHFLLFDMTTPSWWASKVSGIDIDQVSNQILKELGEQSYKSVKALNQQITQTENILKQLKNVQRGNLTGYSGMN